MADKRGDQALKRRGLRLAYFIIVWDAIEGIVAVTAGLIAGSIALVGFGIDSLIEVFLRPRCERPLRLMVGRPGRRRGRRGRRRLLGRASVARGAEARELKSKEVDVMSSAPPRVTGTATAHGGTHEHPLWLLLDARRVRKHGPAAMAERRSIRRRRGARKAR